MCQFIKARCIRRWNSKHQFQIPVQHPQTSCVSPAALWFPVNHLPVEYESSTKHRATLPTTPPPEKKRNSPYSPSGTTDPQSLSIWISSSDLWSIFLTLEELYHLQHLKSPDINHVLTPIKHNQTHQTLFPFSWFSRSAVSMMKNHSKKWGGTSVCGAACPPWRCECGRYSLCSQCLHPCHRKRMSG